MTMQKSPDLLEVLSELRRRYPAWRFGQMIANIAGWADQDVWDVEDDVLLETARSHLAAVARREQQPSAEATAGTSASSMRATHRGPN